MGVVAAKARSISTEAPCVYNLLSRLTLTPNPLKQRFVLAEAIKTSSVPVEKLVSFVDDGNVQPAWTQMLLPLGKPDPPAPSSPGQAPVAAEGRDIHEIEPADVNINDPRTLTPL